MELPSEAMDMGFEVAGVGEWAVEGGLAGLLFGADSDSIAHFVDVIRMY
jgi:hypothetical protein